MIKAYPLLLSLGFVAISACGGSSGGSLSSDAKKYNALVDQYNGYLTKYKIPSSSTPSDIDGTPINQMPSSGTAQYSGVGIVEKSLSLGENKAIGEARLTANFTNSKVTGNVTNFKTNEGESTSGQLSVNSNIFGNDVFGRTTGSINLNGTTHQIDHFNSGVFMGNNAQALAIASTDKTDSRLKPDFDYVSTTIFTEKK